MLDEEELTVIIINKEIFAFMNKYGRVMEAAEFYRMRDTEKTAWVIAEHWKDAVPLGLIDD